MRAGEVRAAAREWVLAEGSKTPGLVGAYVHGSSNELPDDAAYPATSDFDIMLVLEDPGEAIKPGKFRYRGALLEASYLALDALRSPEEVLSSAVLAGGLRSPSVLLDPTGRLTALHEVVAAEFALRKWVRARVERTLETISAGGPDMDERVPLHDQGNARVFGAGITIFPLLAAGLKNLTVRKRYVASRALLAEYGRPDFHEALLDLAGCAAMERARVEHHLGVVTEAYDVAKDVTPKTPYRFKSDISEAARPISIDGTRELIERGLHREAVFWIFATYARCRHILADAGENALALLERFDPGFKALLADLGLGSLAERQARRGAIAAFAPRVREVAEEIMAANPLIRD